VSSPLASTQGTVARAAPRGRPCRRTESRGSVASRVTETRRTGMSLNTPPSEDVTVARAPPPPPPRDGTPSQTHEPLRASAAASGVASLCSPLGRRRSWQLLVVVKARCSYHSIAWCRRSARPWGAVVARESVL
jgi:hypothetical protein